MSEDPRNRSSWDRSSDAYQRDHGRAIDASPEAWGVWRIPEAELRVLDEVAGRDVLELGCGAAQWSVALRRRGARAVALDLSHRQLRHAKQRVDEAELDLPLVLASGERTPFADGSFDLVFSDHGATTFGRPERVVAEASRLLRPGGLFVFCGGSPLLELAWDPNTREAGDRLQRDYFDLYRIDDEKDGATVYQLPFGRWIRLFREHGLTVEDLIEIRPPADAETTFSDFVSRDWARRWPAENLWKLRKS